jgi:hypothetical protein
MLSVRSGGDCAKVCATTFLRGAALYWDAAMDDARLGSPTCWEPWRRRASTQSRRSDRRSTPARRAARQRPGRRPRAFTVDAAAVAVCARALVERISRAWAMRHGRSPDARTHIVRAAAHRTRYFHSSPPAATDGVFFVLAVAGRHARRTAPPTSTTTTADTAGARSRRTEAEIAYLLSEANPLFPQARLQRRDVRATYAGLRRCSGPWQTNRAASREHAFLEPMPECSRSPAASTHVSAPSPKPRSTGGAAARRRGPSSHGVARLAGRADLAWTPREHWDESSRFVAQARTLAATAQVEEDVARACCACHGTRAAAIAALAAGEPRAGGSGSARMSWRRAPTWCTRCATRWASGIWRIGSCAPQPQCVRGLQRPAMRWPSPALFAAELGWSATERDARVAPAPPRWRRSPAVVPAATPSGPPGR